MATSATGSAVENWSANTGGGDAPRQSLLREVRPTATRAENGVVCRSSGIAVVQFPGTNCERETARALASCWGGRVDIVWHAERFGVDDFAAVVLPGGFAYGDHLRAGAIARFSTVMEGIRRFADAGGLVLGICNGFQVLLEAGLLPGAMLRNASLQFRSQWVWCRVERTDTPFTSACQVGQVLRMPIAHGEGNYVSRSDPDGVVLRYCDRDGHVVPHANPNGSRDGIAGICNAAGNVFGLMPHPERAADALLGSADGCFIFESFTRALVHEFARSGQGS